MGPRAGRSGGSEHSSVGLWGIHVACSYLHKYTSTSAADKDADRDLRFVDVAIHSEEAIAREGTQPFAPRAIDPVCHGNGA